MDQKTAAKVMATLGAIVGALAVGFALMTALGVDVSTEMKEAVTGIGGLVLVIAGIWLHPDTPVGPQEGS